MRACVCPPDPVSNDPDKNVDRGDSEGRHVLGLLQYRTDVIRLLRLAGAQSYEINVFFANILLYYEYCCMSF